jgi:hypothetical protein
MNQIHSQLYSRIYHVVTSRPVANMWCLHSSSFCFFTRASYSDLSALPQFFLDLLLLQLRHLIMSQPQTRPSRPINNMPLNRKARRRLALTSVLNNPPPVNVSVALPASASDTDVAPLSLPNRVEAMDRVLASVSEPSPVVNHASPKAGTSRNKKRKRQRMDDASSGNIAANNLATGQVAASRILPSASGPSAPSLASPSRVTVNQPEVPIKPAVAPGPSIQQQMQERSRLLVAQEGNAKLEAQVKTLGEEVSAKNDVSTPMSSVFG